MIFSTDSYNASHFQMYPPGTTEISGYIEARNSSEFPNVSFFGLQYFIKKYLMEPDLSKLDIHAAKMRWSSHGEPFPRKGWQKIKDLGYYPIEIQAVPEGSWVPKNNVLIQIRNTDPDCYWLPTWLETQLVQIWYPTTVATQGKQTKDMLRKYLEDTGCENIEEVLPFMVHDFGYRGSSCYEQASIGGAAHLTNFKGTDTFPALDMIRDYYGVGMAGFSIPASNHAVITSWDSEEAAFKNVLDQFLVKGGVVACVSDSYDFYKALDIWGTKFKDRIMNSGGRLVVRPDCYDDQTEILTPEGWKLFKDLLPSDRVAQFYDGKISFTHYTNLVNQEYTGEMIKFTNEKYKRELIVTPNHRMVKLNRVIGKYEIQEASEIRYHHKHDMCVAGSKIGEINELSAYDKLMIAFQADGRCKNIDGARPLNGKYVLDFNFAKNRKTERLISILEEGGFKYEIHADCRNLDNINPNWNKQTLINVYLISKPKKRFKEWVFLENVSSNWCKEFIDEVSNWDATKRDNDRIKVDNTCKSDMEIVQTIATLAGYRATLTTHTDSRSEKFNDIHTVHIVKKPYIGGQSISIEKVNYTGKIYCVTVPSGILVVRRNGQPIISGNSGNPETVTLKGLTKLLEYFGYTTTRTGHKLLPNCVRMIWGDGINPKTIDQVLYYLDSNDIAAENMVFGMGSALLQEVRRDQASIAFKVNERVTEGIRYPVHKEPVTGKGKASKAGRQALVNCDGYIFTLPEAQIENRKNLLRTVFRDGKLLIDDDFETIRARSDSEW